MGERLLLVDSDVFIILSAAGVLARTTELLGFGLEDLRRLPALENQLTRGRAFRKKYPQGILDTALGFCHDVAPLTQRPSDVGTLAQLAAVNDIDEGEAVMYGLMVDHPLYILASGDKRAMRALAANAGLRNIRDALAGRILCLEAAVHMLVRRDGVTQVANGFTPLRSVNTALRVAFSRGAATTKKDCLRALESYLSDLKNDVGGDFLLIP